MKAFKTILVFGAIGSMVVGCAEYKKDPVDPAQLEEMRAHQKSTPEKGPEKPQILTETIVVTKGDGEVTPKNQPKTADQFVVVSADDDMTFVAGQSGSFKITARPVVTGLKIELKAEGLPPGAKFEKSSDQADVYVLSWTPALNTVTGAEARKTFPIKLVTTVVEVPAGSKKEDIQKLMPVSDAKLHVQLEGKFPTDLQVEGLPLKIEQGSVTPFSVTVLVPGVDDESEQLPMLELSYEKSISGPYTVLDGKKHIIADSKNTKPEYLGNFKWKFSMMFDTKNVAVQPAQNKDGQVFPNASESPVSMTFKAKSPHGTESKVVTKQVHIQMSTPVPAPRFDFSGLGKETWELIRGEKNVLNFTVSSANSKALVKVESANFKTLPGSPVMTCAADKAKGGQQNCSITWKVPCDGNDNTLAVELAMTATATISGKNTDPTKQSLKTSVSATTKCKTPKPGATP